MRECASWADERVESRRRSSLAVIAVDAMSGERKTVDSERVKRSKIGAARERKRETITQRLD